MGRQPLLQLKDRCRRSYPIIPSPCQHHKGTQPHAVAGDASMAHHNTARMQTHTFTPQVFSVCACPCWCLQKYLWKSVCFCSQGGENFVVTGACQLCICDIILLVPLKKMTSAPSLSLQRCCPWLPSIFAFCAADGTIDLYPWWTGDTPSCVCSDCLTHHCLKYFWRVCHMCLECTVKSFHGLSVYSKTVFWFRAALAMLVDYQQHNICYS